jgi:hypothetical protein
MNIFLVGTTFIAEIEVFLQGGIWQDLNNLQQI